MMLQTLALSIVSLAGLVAGSCEAPYAISMCCISLAPYTDNAYVWNDVCGNTGLNENVLVASGCEVSSSCTYEGYYAACCVEYMPNCPSTSGAIGYNCTGNEVE